jgi:hypothetical protein
VLKCQHSDVIRFISRALSVQCGKTVLFTCLYVLCMCVWLVGVFIYAKTRSTSSTSSNETSSRSHAILQINITKSGELSKLTFVDLAGSEWFDDSNSHDKEVYIHIHIHT